jgi:hypothetical protein
VGFLSRVKPVIEFGTYQARSVILHDESRPSNDAQFTFVEQKFHVFERFCHGDFGNVPSGFPPHDSVRELLVGRTVGAIGTIYDAGISTTDGNAVTAGRSDIGQGGLTDLSVESFFVGLVLPNRISSTGWIAYWRETTVCIWQGLVD